MVTVPAMTEMPPKSRTRPYAVAAIVAVAVLMAAGVVLVLALTGGHTSGGSAKAATYTPQQMASKLGCNYEGSSTELFVKEGGPCGGWNLYDFADNAARDNYVKAAQQFGGVFLEGDRWVVVAESSDLIDRAKAKLGGTKL